MIRILMIDDEPAALTPYQIYLQQQGCTVDTAQTPAEAVTQLSRYTYQLLLLDVMMPEVSGFDLCGELKRLTKAPVVFLSSMTDDCNQLQGFSQGGTDYIAKDCSLPLFWARVSARLKAAEQPESLWEFPPLVLDLPRQQAQMSGNDLQLTRTEFQLLLLLCSHPQEVWSTEQVYRKLWGENGPINTALVQMHLSRMRNKIEKAFPRHEFIETVWGKGYRFMPRDV